MEPRIIELEQTLRSSFVGVASEHTANATAVLDGYRSGFLKYLLDHYYVSKGGKMFAVPRRLAGYNPEKVLFDEFQGPWGIWIESISALNLYVSF